MKKNLLALITIGTIGFAASLAEAQTWNLANDFTTDTANPGYPVGFGVGATSVYDGPVPCGGWTLGCGNLNLTRTSVLDAYDPNGWGNAGLNTWYLGGYAGNGDTISHNTSGSTIAGRLFPNSVMMAFYNEGLGSLGSQVYVQWVAPYNGLYSVDLNWNFNDSNTEGVNAEVFKNGMLAGTHSGPAPEKLASWRLTTLSQTASWSTNLTLNAGENLIFAVNNNNSANYGAANTLIDLTITKITPAAPTVASFALNSGIAVTGTVGGHYQVEYATALAPTTWLLLQDIPSLPSSPYTVYDPAPSSQAKHLYRAVLVP